MTNKDKSIRNACYRQFDFGAGTVSLEEKTMSSGAFSLTKSTRPSLDSLTSNLKISEKYEICLNYSAILPQNIRILYDNEVIEDLVFTPIYSFDDTHVDKDLLVEGRLPNKDNLSEVVINETAARVISASIKKDAINEYLYLDHSAETNYVSEYEEYVSDTFYLYKEIQIVGVVKEINYLPSRKIYYSYSAFEEFTKEYVLENLSTYNNSNITWYDRVAQAEDYSPLSSYSYSLFLKDYRDREYPFLEDVFTDGLVYSSSSILLTNSLFNFLSVAEYGVLLFLIIAFIGTFLILSIMSFTNFSEDHRSSAILTSIGASQEQIEEIYL
jgi:ABC-type antimicrobial peptide transport system permease subunit